MRLLIYILAMMTGFSAAEAARPVSESPAALGSAVAQASIMVASLASESDVASGSLLGALPTLSAMVRLRQYVSAGVPIVQTTPIARHDISRQ
ncbi:MAG: hypothetical protein WBO17_02715 [Sphingorhabdus sp.]